MRTCVSFIMVNTAIKEINIALQHETPCTLTNMETGAF